MNVAATDRLSAALMPGGPSVEVLQPEREMVAVSLKAFQNGTFLLSIGSQRTSWTAAEMRTWLIRSLAFVDEQEAVKTQALRHAGNVDDASA